MAVDAIGGAAEGVRVDSTNMAQLQALFERVKARHGKLDVLVANAGGGSFLPLGQITEAHFDDTFARNVKARCSPCRARCRCWAKAHR
jgi:NAD(P)-dependent dehydrogenase (short-subunit alcohol dehydrogenase family)